eukprot:35049-Chlamydomonas_euryale.AAC.1
MGGGVPTCAPQGRGKGSGPVSKPLSLGPCHLALSKLNMYKAHKQNVLWGWGSVWDPSATCMHAHAHAQDEQLVHLKANGPASHPLVLMP